MTQYRVLDTETTGVDVFSDRVVTAFIGVWDTDKTAFTQHLEFLVNPGIPIPAEASEVHGVTDELAQQGLDPVEFLEVFFRLVHDFADLPVVVYNAPFDLTLINAELTRYGHATYGWGKRQVIDPLVLERHYNKYKKGKKRLSDIVAQRGIPVDETRLHSADYDAEMTARVLEAQVAEWGTPTTAEQAQWHETWRADFEKYLRRVKEDATLEIRRGWPVQQKEDNE